MLQRMSEDDFDQDLEEFVNDHGGVVGVPDLADYLDLSSGWIRSWAADNCVSKIAGGYAFSNEAAQKLLRDLGEIEADEGEEAEEEEEELEESEEE
jgi:hypothetical protein